MNTVWDILYLRRPMLNYVSPPVCEVIFSGSSNPVIVLSERPIGRVTGLVLGGEGGFTLSWNVFPGALCYNVYRLSGVDTYEIIASCIPGPDFILPGPGIYVVTPITLEGEGPVSDPIELEGPANVAFLVIDSDGETAVPFSLGPLDINGDGSGTTPSLRTYNLGQVVSITAPITHGFSVFEKWQRNGADFSEELTVSFVMSQDYDLVAFYGCGEQIGDDVPADFTLGSPTSLGIFQVPPGLSAVSIAGDAAASNYTLIYKGGSIQGDALTCGPSEDCAECCFLPPGCAVTYDNGVSSLDVSDSATNDDNCIVSQALLESQFPVEQTFGIVHTGGSLFLQWTPTVTLNSVVFPITDFTCGNSCPQWEVIQDSGLIAQPASWRIRDYDAFADLLMPLACLDAMCPNCEELTSTNFPLETDPNAVEWDGTSTMGDIHDHNYISTFFVDGIPSFFMPGSGFPIMIRGFQALLAEVAGPRDQAFIIAEFFGPQTDPFPPSAVDRYWRFIIYATGPNGPPIWCGVKAGGSTPIGQYSRVSCVCPASAPQCMYLEEP